MYRYYFVFAAIAISATLLSANTKTTIDKRVGAPVPQTETIQPLPKVTHAYSISPDVLCLEIDACEVLPSRQITYNPSDKDSITINRETKLGEKYSMRVIRNGYPLGMLAGKNREILTLHERLIGVHLDCNGADKRESYVISSVTDDNFHTSVSPIAINRKSKPTNWSEEERFHGEFYAAKHHIYITLPYKMKQGHSYTITLLGLNVESKSVNFTYNPYNTRSEAIHCSQVGFRCDDPVKLSYMSCWMGSAGGYDYDATSLRFHIIDCKSEKVVFSSSVAKHWYKQNKEGIGTPKNHIQANLYCMDFSQFSRPGEYRVYVEDVGCSYPFVIDDNNSWLHAFKVSMKGLYHQRSGVSMLPPYTDFARARMYNPQDGVKVYRSTASYMHSGNGYNALGTERNNFDTLVLGKTDELEPEGWGGVMDAGDWDRQIRHVKGTARRLFDLVEFNKDYFKSINLNIPESDNNIPDIVDEAMFQIDIFRRMQTPEGGIRGGIESSEHPAEGCASWQEMLTVLAYAPDFLSSYIYAGVAARAAYVLRMLDYDNQAEVWQQSAVKAMNWAEKENVRWFSSKEGLRVRNGVREAMNVERRLAAVELFRLTLDQQWHKVFLSIKSDDASRQEASFIYASMGTKTDKKVAANCRKEILEAAEKVLTSASSNGFAITTAYENVALGGWSSHLSLPASVNLIYAHRLTNDEKYLKSMVRSSLFSVGANPMNIVLTTGLGKNPIKHPLHEDSRHTGQPAPIGITVCGPCELPVMAQYFEGFEKRLATECYPNGMLWPAMESYFDIYGCDFQNEYVVDGNIGYSAYIWGYLASRR